MTAIAHDVELETVAAELAGKVCPCRRTAPKAGHDPDRSVECDHTRQLVLATLDALAQRGVRPPEPPKPKDATYKVVGTWLVEVVDDCTCGTNGLPYGHEPGCGTDPVVDLSRLMAIPTGPEHVIEANAIDDAADQLGNQTLNTRWQAVGFLRDLAKAKRGRA